MRDGASRGGKRMGDGPSELVVQPKDAGDGPGVGHARGLDKDVVKL